MRHTKILALALSLSFMAAYPSFALADNAQDKEFESLVMEGIKLYKKGASDPGNYAKAIEYFEKAKAISPIPDVVYNIARSHHLLGNYEKAYISYCEYSLVSAANAEKVKGYMDTVKTKLGSSANSVQCNAALVKAGTIQAASVPRSSVSSSTSNAQTGMIKMDLLGKTFEELMTEGLNHYKKGAQDPNNYSIAIAYFEAAYKKDSSVHDIIYNIARSYHLMGDCENALENYKKFSSTSKANKTKVAEFVKSLSAQCGESKGSLILNCEPANALVSIDNAPNVACSGTHQLKAGNHALLITAEGYEPETRNVSITSNAKSPVAMNVSMRAFVVRDPEAEAAATTQTATTEPSAQTTDSRVITETAIERAESPGFGGMFWSGVALSSAGTLMMLGGGIALGCAFRSKIHYSGDEQFTFYQRNPGLIGGGGAVLGIGAAAAIAGITLFIVDAVKKNKSQDESDPQAVRFAPTFSVSAEEASAGFTMTF